MIPYGWVAAAVVAAAVWGHGWVTGASHEQDKARQADADQRAVAYRQGQAAGIVRDRIVTEYVDRVQVIEKRGATIIKEVPVYVSTVADAQCTVPVGFVRLHDASAAGLSAPGSAGAADETASGVALSTVTETVAGNYTECHANAEQMRQLQDLIKAQGAPTE